MSLEQIKVRLPDLLVGMYVARLDRPWLETPYLLQGFEIKSEEDIEELGKYVEHVYIDVEKSTVVEEQKPQQSVKVSDDKKKRNLIKTEPQSYKKLSNFNSELECAFEGHSILSKGVEDVMNDISNQRDLKFPILKKAVTPMVESVVRNPDAFSWLTMMKNKDDYTYNHSVSSSIWAVAFGRNLGLPEQDLLSLALGALLFDVGKLKLPEDLLNSPNRYDEEEFNQVKAHVDHGLEIVKSIEGIDDVVVDMVATHHERHDGSGYPNALNGDQIPLFGRIAGLIDCYDALISDRSYASANSPHDAVRILYNLSGTEFQPELVEQFIQVVGIYPVGTLIEMSDGRVGAIVSHNRVWRLKPKVMLILDTNKEPYPDFKIIDTYKTAQGEDGEPLKILKSIEPGLYGIDQKQLYL